MVNKKTFIRLCLIYLCVLLPLLGTNFFIMKNFLDKIQMEEEGKLLSQLHATVDVINDDFAEYRNKGVILFQNKEFSSNLNLVDAVDVNEAARLLESLSMFDDNKNKILVYYGEEELYTSDGMVRLNTYFGKTLGCTKQSVSNAIDTIGMSQFTIEALQGKSGLEYLLYHIPVGNDLYGYSRSMEVIISVSQLEKMIGSVLYNDEVIIELNIGGYKSLFYYADQKCRVLAGNVAEESLRKYDNEPLEYISENSDISVHLWYDVKTQLEDIYKLRNINLLLLTLGLLLSVAISFALSMIRLTHLKKVLDSILHKNEINKEKHIWKKNEFDYIQMAVNETIKENNSIKKKEIQYRRVLLQQVAMLIFHGLLRERKEIQEALKVCGTELYEEYFFVFGISVKSQEQIEKVEELLQADIHFPNIENGKYYLFILYELPFGDYDMEKRHELAETLQNILAGEGISLNNVAMSKVYSHISMANYAYIEVLSILESSVSKKQKVQCWEEWIRFNGVAEMWSDNMQLKDFRQAVKEKNEQQALAIVRQALLRESEREKVRNICYMFLQALTIEIDIMSEEEKTELMYEINDIDVNDEWNFVESVSQILKKYCNQQDDLSDFAKVIKFVEENYTNYEISLLTVAEYAGFSKSKTSRLFKMYTGEAYIDYVTRLRMEKVKELLEGTDMSVKEILQQVGYLDITNASKKFKAYFQINPSVYRAQMRKEREDK